MGSEGDARAGAAGLERVVGLVTGRKARAQICVLHRGKVVLDQAFGCKPDSLFLIYSASKPFVALAVHLLAEHGAVSLDDPVTTHWPEYRQNGKQSITIRQVLSHRAGVPVAGGMLRTIRSLPSWERSVRDAERAHPRYPPGQVPAYHFITYGFILGEVVQRVSGIAFRQFLTDSLLAPLGLDDVHLGLPDAAWARDVPARATHPSELPNQYVFNRRAVRQAVIPAVGISTNARQLARFYQMLAEGGQLDGVRVLRPDTISEACRPTSDGHVDAFIKRPVRWAQGFQLGGPGADPRDMARLLGSRSSRNAFGHAGNASCVAWADPGRQLVMAYLSDLQPGIDVGIRHVGDVSDAVLAACR
jgi:CubicO group peptidase (beta-lactamase class C family)